MNLARQFLIGVVLAAVLAIAFVAAQPHHRGHSAMERTSPKKGNENFEAMDLTEFRAFQRSLKGKVVLVNFWASWCGPCGMEIPHLEALHRKYAGEEFVMLGLVSDVSSAIDLQDYEKSIGSDITYRIIHDADFSIFREYQAYSLPRTIVFDRSGKARQEFPGYGPGMEAAFDDLIAKLLKEK